MPDVWEPIQSDLENKVGGAARLVQLLDRDGDGVADSAAVTAALANGIGRVRGALQVKHEPEALAAIDAADAVWLKRLATVEAAWTAFNDAGEEWPVPAKLADEFAQTETDLENIATGKRRVGRASGGKAPALAQPIGTVDPDPLGMGMSVTAMMRGFR